MPIERLIVLGAAIALFLIGVRLWRMWAARRLHALSRQAIPPQLDTMLDRDGPALLYFTAQHCVQCRLQQTPILHKLAANAEIPIHTVDALETPDLAHFFGVMTVPTTVLLDDRRRPAAINHGLAPLQRLQAQAAAVA